MSISSDTTNRFVTADIENRREGKRAGELLSIDTCWVEGEQFEHCELFTWGDWLDFVFAKAATDKRFRSIYAHNGGGWDWPGILGYLMHHLEVDSVEAIPHGSTLAAVILRRGEIRVVLLDSLKLLPQSLDALGERLCGSRKVDKGGKTEEWLFDNDLATYQRYLRQDTELLSGVLHNSLTIIRKEIGEIPSFSMTLAATAKKLFEKHFCPVKVKSPHDERLRLLLRLAYSGGRVEVFKPGLHENVRVYDVNSLYPSVMRRIPVPYNQRGYWTQKPEFGKPSVYCVTWEQKRRNVLPLLLKQGNGAYEGTGYVFSPELRLLKLLDPNCRIEIHEGYVFTDCKVIFEEYVNTLYKLRTANKGTALDFVCKILLNSLYGKYGARTRRGKIVIPESYDWLYEQICNDEITVQDFGDMYKLVESDPKRREKLIDKRKSPAFLITQDMPFMGEHVGIAGMITSEARCELYKGFLAAGSRNVVYCDTDSVHCVGSIAAGLVDEKDLGKFKLEKTGRGIYVGKKTYAVDDGKKVTIKAKGVRLGGELGGSLSFDELVAMHKKGAAKLIKFRNAVTPREVLKGKKACVMVERKRTIRKTANTVK